MSSKADHIAGTKNKLADFLSRHKIHPTEWELYSTEVHKIFQIWSQPNVDLFTTLENKKTAVFSSWVNHSQILAVDALSMSWDNLYGFALPPLPLIPKVLDHMQQFQCEIILTSPHWPRQMWFSHLLQILFALQRKLPDLENLKKPRKKIVHFKLTAWRLSTRNSKQRAFSEKY